jgi:hypothetical protein
MKSTRAILIALALVKLSLHLFTSQGYGTFRDEFYYIACSEHLDWGYVDHPPLSMVLLRVTRLVLGDSLTALRFLPAVAGALTVYLVGLMTRKLGGGRFAIVLAMVAAIVAPAYLGTNHKFSMNSFDILFWALSAYLLMHILEGGDRRLWLILGLVLGLGLENKISVLWLGTGLAVGLVVTESRKWLATPWPWVCGGLSLALFLPYVIWQMKHGWPTLEFIEVATTEKMAAVSAVDFFADQFFAMHPFNLPIWLSGLVFFLFLKDGKIFRLLGWVYIAVIVILLSAGTSRSGYLVPTYTWLLAAGGVAIEAVLNRWKAGVWLRSSAVGLLLLGGVAMVPLALPVLPVETYIRYAKAIGVAPSTAERKEIGALPQDYADMHGWREIVGTVSNVFHGLTEEEREDVAILAPNYGVAGAIDFLGTEYSLPSASSSHNNYWLWGPPETEGKVLIVISWSERGVSRWFESYERAATTDCGYCMPYENNRPVWVCRGLKAPMEEFWKEIKNFN